MPRRTGLWIAWLAAALGCGDAAAVDEDDAGAGPRRMYGRDGGSCGDGMLDRGEDCDGKVIGQSCESLGLVRGPLSCTAQCTIDTSLCGTDPRPDPPFRPDGGLFFDGGFRDAETVKRACDLILSCDAVPLPSTGDLFAFGLPESQQAFCEQQIIDSCLECALVEGEPDLDPDGSFTPCESDCRAECWDLSFPLAEAVLDPDRCVATAADFVSSFDASCLCSDCALELRDCLTNPLCHAALICVDGTGCQGEACSTTGPCVGPIQELSIVFGSGQLEGLRSCIADSGCQEP